MGLGAWLAAMTEKKHYQVEEERERREVREMPEAEVEEIYEVFDTYGVAREAITPLVSQLMGNEDMWVKVRRISVLVLPVLTRSIAQFRGLSFARVEILIPQIFQVASAILLIATRRCHHLVFPSYHVKLSANDIQLFGIDQANIPLVHDGLRAPPGSAI